MIDMSRRRRLGDSVAEYLETLPYETDSDGECIWRIVPAGESFGFEGDDLTEFVRLSVLRLLESGAVPVRYADEGELEWREQTHYGKDQKEAADAIVAEWLDAGGGRQEWDYLWFVTPRVLKTSRRWQAGRAKSE